MNISRAVLIAGFFLLLALFLSLGEWQLRRAEEKTALFDQIYSTEALPVLTTPIEDSQLEEYRYRRLALRGRYAPARQLLLDAMIHEGQAGYQVLTPFRLTDDGRWLLVNRGWVRAGPDRRSRPQIAVDDDVREIRGRINALPRPGLQLQAVDTNEVRSWPQVVLYPTIEELEELLDIPLFRYQVWLDAEAPDGFVREWEPAIMAPEQHIGYAIQWFGLACVLVVMAVFLSVSAARRDNS